ncbi:MAG TPA: hypothetical protein PKA16_03970 [Ottowia sp.]|uniref:hypothetical protein n=1 Tax=Ottowia sp. TaxID=1898956 RepID=UPI002C7C1919|nr:hypothetical protein [Ottowia sp.]HMN20531.1 hypothetical protein [Ottowia sp.]
MAAGLQANHQHRFSWLLRTGEPIFAAINGPVAGIGLCMTLFCDFRTMAEGHKLTTGLGQPRPDRGAWRVVDAAAADRPGPRHGCAVQCPQGGDQRGRGRPGHRRGLQPITGTTVEVDGGTTVDGE